MMQWLRYVRRRSQALWDFHAVVARLDYPTGDGRTVTQVRQSCCRFPVVKMRSAADDTTMVAGVVHSLRVDGDRVIVSGHVRPHVVKRCDPQVWRRLIDGGEVPCAAELGNMQDADDSAGGGLMVSGSLWAVFVGGDGFVTAWPGCQLRLA